ncbi:nitrate reductase molybdenum cofactor assembly chaperone [uncultured Sphingomonas sp.]|jgi:nitrate reductase delta subunit|uniref:nitrate reductase molybdenum cofactor assembly chaperone n=1 Tax=uncultured Sphingomonas sp. TaxID=158754 RepID=UPI0025D6DE8F|nr:nitrate reductase molybdenum cofactor assembly chaperone [uncultured Sphingomonas sp.]
MMMTLRGLAVLLGYPSAELQENIGSVREALARERMLPPAELRRLESLLVRLEGADLLDVQSEYSELFDRSRSLSLHLFEHVHGDNRERGQAMIDLGEQYVGAGFFLDTGELPDFIPVFLEYASCLPLIEAREILSQPAHVFAALAERLDRRPSPYAAIFHGLVALASERPDADAVAGVEQNTPAVDPESIDDEWEEAPVSFAAGAAHEMGGPTGFVAKVRAGNRPVNRESGR